MKKMKFISKVALILLFACVFTLLTGCTTPATPTDPPETNPVLFNGLTEFIAVPFADCGVFSAIYELRVKVSDGKVYLNNKQYLEIPYDDFEITHSSGYFHCYKEGIKATAFFGELNNSNLHCLLQANTESGYGQQIAVYEIEGAYYFLSLNNSSEVSRIHFASPKIGG